MKGITSLLSCTTHYTRTHITHCCSNIFPSSQALTSACLIPGESVDLGGSLERQTSHIPNLNSFNTAFPLFLLTTSSTHQIPFFYSTLHVTILLRHLRIKEKLRFVFNKSCGNILYYTSVSSSVLADFSSNQTSTSDSLLHTINYQTSVSGGIPTDTSHTNQFTYRFGLSLLSVRFPYPFTPLPLPGYLTPYVC